jgi:hypothetical protein
VHRGRRQRREHQSRAAAGIRDQRLVVSRGPQLVHPARHEPLEHRRHPAIGRQAQHQQVAVPRDLDVHRHGRAGRHGRGPERQPDRRGAKLRDQKEGEHLSTMVPRPGAFRGANGAKVRRIAG